MGLLDFFLRFCRFFRRINFVSWINAKYFPWNENYSRLLPEWFRGRKAILIYRDLGESLCLNLASQFSWNFANEIIKAAEWNKSKFPILGDSFSNLSFQQEPAGPGPSVYRLNWFDGEAKFGKWKISRTVECPVGYWRDWHATFEYAFLVHRETHSCSISTVTPAPNGSSLSVDKRELILQVSVKGEERRIEASKEFRISYSRANFSLGWKWIWLGSWIFDWK